MDSGHLTEETHRRLWNDELRGRELADALRHAGSCELCAPRGRELSRIEDEALQAIEATAPSEHLDFDTQLLPLVEGRLSAADLEIADSHLDDCAICRAEVDDLRAAARAPRERRSHWIPVAAAACVGAIALLALLTNRTRPAPTSAPPPVPVTRPVPAVTAPPAPVRQPPAEWIRLVDTAVTAKKLPYPADLDDLAPAPDDLRGSGGEAKNDGLTPSHVVVREPRPRFSWSPRTGATYVVTVFANDAVVARSDILHAAHWTPRSELAHGVTYVWQVEITRDGGTEHIPALPAPPAMFRIVRSEDARAIEAAEAGWPEDHLLHAVLLARAGLRREAERALERAKTVGDARATDIK